MTCVGRAWRPALRTTSTIVLNSGAVAVDSQRREPLEHVRTSTGQSRSEGTTIVLNGGAVAVDSQRREPLVPVRTPTGQSRSDGRSAATGQNLLEVAARLCLVVWEAFSSPPALSPMRTVGSRRRHGAAVPVGTKKMFELLVAARL